MQIKVLKTIAEAEAISSQWNELLNCCNASHVPFLQFEYLKTWWQALGGGEWSSGELFILVGSHEDGELIGIAPLFFTTNREGKPALMLLGSIEISDYLDLIVRTEDLPEFIAEMCKFLADVKDPPWKVLDLYNLPDSSPTLPILRAEAEKIGWGFNQQTLQPCPTITLPGDWETYLQQIDKKQRHEIRRKMRRADEHQPPAQWYFVQDEARLDEELDEFLDLMTKDPEKARFLSAQMRAQMHAIAHVAFQAGWLQLAFLQVGDQKAAGYMNFDFAGQIWVYNSGLDPSFREFSAGWVLLAHLLKWANENNRHSFDFMRGSEDYKYRFGGVDRFVLRACLEKA